VVGQSGVAFPVSDDPNLQVLSSSQRAAFFVQDARTLSGTQLPDSLQCSLALIRPARDNTADLIIDRSLTSASTACLAPCSRIPCLQPRVATAWSTPRTVSITYTTGYPHCAWLTRSHQSRARYARAQNTSTPSWLHAHAAQASLQGTDV
jgi:hypothetical protein